MYGSFVNLKSKLEVIIIIIITSIEMAYCFHKYGHIIF